jgi:HK97 family phage major capsid protein
MDRLADHDKHVMADIERKVLSVGGPGSPELGGANLVPEFFVREIIRNLVLVSPMRQIARVQTVSSTPVLLPKRTTNLAAAWVAETAQHGADEPTFVQLSIPVFEARVTSEVSNQLLEDSAFDLAAELARDMALEFARLEGQAFMTGNGTSQPFGILADSSFTSTITTGTGVLNADNIIDLFHAVPSIYAQNGTWLMTRATMGTVRKSKTSGTGVYLWTESLQPGNPPSILGRPVVEMPGLTLAASPQVQVIAFGDWSAYRIFDRVGLDILRDPYSRARNSVVAFHARKRVGGALANAEAVRGFQTA